MDLPGRAGDRVGQLVPVLGGQLSLAGGLGQHHTDRLERLRVAASDSVEVARSLSQLVEALHPIRGELRGDVLDVAEGIDGLVGIGLRAGGQLGDLVALEARELERVPELERRIRSLGRLRGVAAQHGHDATHGGDTSTEAETASEHLAEAAGLLLRRVELLVNVPQPSDGKLPAEP